MMKFTKGWLLFFSLMFFGKNSMAQSRDSTAPALNTLLRIVNLNPFVTLPADSTINHTPVLNKVTEKYFWYLRNSPVGMKMNKDNGNLYFKADKSYFLYGKLLYDFPHKVMFGVTNTLSNETADSSFTLIFYNTEIIPSRIKLSVNAVQYIDEGDTLNFTVQCEVGSFPIENITFYSAVPIKTILPINQCNDHFSWTPSFDFVKQTDSAGVKVLTVNFIGSTRFMMKDTGTIKIIVRDALNYPIARQEYEVQVKNIRSYMLQLKYSFLLLDRNIKKVKNTRTTFDIGSSTTALTGTILNTSSDPGSQKFGKILLSVGISLIPVKEAVSPQKVCDQNQASLISNSIRRFKYMHEDNSMTEKELNSYFNNQEVNKKYRLRRS